MPKNGLIRAYDHQLQIFQRFADAGIIVGCFALAVWIRGVPWDDKYTIAAVSTVLLFYLFSKPTNLYQSYRIGGIMEELRPVAMTWIATVASAVFIAYVFKVGQEYSRIAVGIAILTAPVVLISWRLAIRQLLMWLRAQGHNTRAVVIVGTGETARELATNIMARPWTGLKLIGFVTENPYDDTTPITLESGTTVNVLGTTDTLLEETRNNRVDIVYIAIPLNQRRKLDEILIKLGDTTVSMYIVPDMYTAGIMQGHWVTIGGVPTVSVIDSPIQGVGSWVKRAEDILVSLLVLFVMAVPMAFIAVMIKLTSPGPVLYVQRRYGVNCTPIDIYKFRTMTVTESDKEFNQAKPNDPRVTSFGAFLRRTSLDELPQFFNVLAGTMSVVGPRPHPVALNEAYRGKVDAYTLRHKVKPGITGLAQINGCRGQTAHDGAMKERVRYDIGYINGWSIWMDLKIILATPFALLKGENAH